MDALNLVLLGDGLSAAPLLVLADLRALVGAFVGLSLACLIAIARDAMERRSDARTASGPRTARIELRTAPLALAAVGSAPVRRKR